MLRTLCTQPANQLLFSKGLDSASWVPKTFAGGGEASAEQCAPLGGWTPQAAAGEAEQRASPRRRGFLPPEIRDDAGPRGDWGH